LWGEVNVNKKKAVLLMAYGSPEKDEDVEAYYTHIRGGRKPTVEELDNLKARYRAIGGSSPLLRLTESTAYKLEEKLRSNGNEVRVYAGMKHWHPFIAETFEKMLSDGVTDLLALVLAPHFSKMSVGSYHDSVRKANSESGYKINLHFVNEWYENPVFLEKWSQRIRKACETKFRDSTREEIFFLFSAHSLPEKILSWNDPYKDQLLETAQMLAKRQALLDEQYGFAFQSAGHTSEPWLGPDVLDKLESLKNWKNVLMIPIGFVSDHLEILYDIDIEAKSRASELGTHLERTESYNDSDDFIEVLSSVIRENSFL
jgi:protoporphyrin/coproporphyrin ferrochelatase